MPTTRAVRRTPRWGSPTLQARVSHEIKRSVERVCRKQRIEVSTFVRRAVVNELKRNGCG